VRENLGVGERIPATPTNRRKPGHRHLVSASERHHGNVHRERHRPQGSPHFLKLACTCGAGTGDTAPLFGVTVKAVQVQMAMISTAQKPTQRMRFGEHSVGLPGSTLERGMCREKRQELGRPERFLRRLLVRVVNPQWSEQVGRTEITSRRAKDLRGSD